MWILVVDQLLIRFRVMQFFHDEAVFFLKSVCLDCRCLLVLLWSSPLYFRGNERLKTLIIIMIILMIILGVVKYFFIQLFLTEFI